MHAIRLSALKAPLVHTDLVCHASRCLMLSHFRSECISRGASASLHSSALRSLTAEHTSTTARAENVLDVIIVGGGMVGAALAAALRCGDMTRHLRVAVLDRQELRADQPPVDGVPDARVSTVTPGSQRLLDRVGAWQHCAPAAAAFSDMQVWDSHGYVRYDASDAGEAVMGHVVENARLQAACLAAMQSAPGGAAADVRWPVSVKALQLPPYSSAKGSGDVGRLAAVELDDGQTVNARLVVGADGARSRVRELAQLRSTGFNYNQRGVVASVRLVQPTATAWQRFLDTGPIALLPVRGGLANIVWTTTPAQASDLERCGPFEFAAAVNVALSKGQPAGSPLEPLLESIRSTVGPALGPALGPMLGSALSGTGGPAFRQPPIVETAIGPPAKSFPLHLVHAGRYVRPRVALIGDAAHAVHPLAGQGVNLGFGDAEALAAALGQAVANGTDIGDLSMLQADYEEPRQRANVAMMAALDGLKRVFGPQRGPIAGLRGAGLSIINAAPQIKQQILRYAMG